MHSEEAGVTAEYRVRSTGHGSLQSTGYIRQGTGHCRVPGTRQGLELGSLDVGIGGYDY